MRNYEMILGQNCNAQFGYKENGNILVLGQVGTYKTRGYILPNILQQDGISMVIADTKGELRKKTQKLLEEKGYVVKSINFDEPDRSKNRFNPLAYIHSPEDILAVSTILVSDIHGSVAVDPYWDQSAILLMNAVMAYLMEQCTPTERTLANVRKLVCALKISDDAKYVSPLEHIFEDLRKEKPECFAVKQWDAFATVKQSSRTVSCIISVLLSKFTQFLTPDIEMLTSRDTLQLDSLGKEKTALFVSVSDVDRSKDKLVSVFYSLLLTRLRNVADQQTDGGLPIHVHCFLDDFATNVVIPNFDNYISSLRSREVSFSLVLQSERQLQKLYGASANTIVSNCAWYLFFGSRDLDGCQEIARRMNVPLDRVLYKPKEEVFIFGNFSRPQVERIYDVSTHADYSKLENESDSAMLAEL